MVKKGNEKGYTLLIVLLVVTLIMIITTSFFSVSLSNAKQERTVDTNNLAVVAAEMGVDYYKTAITNAFNIKKSELMEQAESEVNALDFERLNTEEISQKLEEIRQMLITTLEGYFDTIISSIPSPEAHSISATMGFDNLIEPSILADSDGVKIEGTVIGYSENRKYTKELDFDITFEVPPILLSSLGGGESDKWSADFDKLFPNPIPSGLPACTDNKGGEVCLGSNKTSLQNKDRSTIYFPDGFSKSTGNLDFNTNDTRLYIKSYFSVHNANNMSRSILYVDGKFNVNQNSNNMNHSLFKINGPFTVGGNMVEK